MNIIIADSKGWFKIKPSLSKKLNIKMIKDKSELSENTLKKFNPSHLFFAHWHWIVPARIYEKYSCIVFHTAPLPYGRGGSPIQNLILNGFKHSPVCAIKMVKDLDSGPIYTKMKISLEGSLEQILSRINSAINKLILKIINNKLIPKEQKGKVHVFKRLTQQDNKIQSQLTLEQIFDKIRMLDHFSYPDAYIKHGNLILNFSKAKLSKTELSVMCTIKKDFN